MQNLKELLLKRREYLLAEREKRKHELENAPNGTVRLDTSKKNTQFYFRENSASKAGIYIPQNELGFVQTLIQKDYDQKVLHSIEQELKAIERYLSGLPSKSAEEIYEFLHPERQKLITPIRQRDEQYIREWEGIPFQRKEIDDSVPPLYTEKGERVRSKSEVIIADILYREGIPYKYECPLTLKGLGKIHPDFTTLNVRKRKVVYWEHLGMMDDVEYVETAINRKEIYERNGIFLGDNLILTFETKNCPLNQRTIRTQIQRYLR